MADSPVLPRVTLSQFNKSNQRIERVVAILRRYLCSALLRRGAATSPSKEVTRVFLKRVVQMGVDVVSHRDSFSDRRVHGMGWNGDESMVNRAESIPVHWLRRQMQRSNGNDNLK